MPLPVANDDRFFEVLEDLGFFEDVAGQVAGEYSMIFELARVLEREDAELATTLAPVLYMKTNASPKPPTDKKYSIPNLPHSEDYEAQLIAHLSELPRIYPHQFLLPEKIFYQRVAERTLWLPRAVHNKSFRYQRDADEFAPDSRKQKMYLLFDTSKSMREHFRIHLAKAIAYVYVKHNRRELGTIFFRTFDAEVGPLMIADTKSSYNDMIRQVMRVTKLGGGTVLAKALETAINDIQSYSRMSEAEILVITDGAAHIDADKIRSMAGDLIKINTIKIGQATASPDAKFVRDIILTSQTDEAKRIRQLQDGRRELERTMHSTHSDAKKSAAAHELAHIDKQIAVLSDKFAHKVRENYGREIEQVSALYINVPDIDPAKLGLMTDERRSRVSALLAELRKRLEHDPSSTTIRNASVLLEHLQLLDHLHVIVDEELKTEMAELLSSLQQLADRDYDNDESTDLSEEDRIVLHKVKVSSKKAGMMRLSIAQMIKLIVRVIRHYIVYFRRKLRSRRLLKVFGPRG